MGSIACDDRGNVVQKDLAQLESTLEVNASCRNSSLVELLYEGTFVSAWLSRFLFSTNSYEFTLYLNQSVID